MKQVYQTHMDDEGTGPGNCMQAACASLLELPLDLVPDFILQPDPFGSMDLFCAAYGLVLEKRGPKHTPTGLYLVTGKSTQGHEHIVIYRWGRIVHDPNPHGRGLVDISGVIVPRPFTQRAAALVR